MHSKYRYLILAAKVLIICFLIIQPYNFFCNLTSLCRSFHLSYYIPSKEGKEQMDVAIEARSHVEDLLIVPEVTVLTTVTGRKNIVKYSVKNDSDHLIRFRPLFYVDPQYYEQFIERFQCSCSKEVKLKAGEETVLNIEFKLKSELDSQVVQKDEPQREENAPRMKIGFKIIPY